MSFKAGDNYTCKNCAQTFVTDWGEDDALAECEEIFGFVPESSDRAVICDICFTSGDLLTGLKPPDLQGI